ncbi:ABC transporter permease subunit [Heyndrickxia acidiproducens]|uniref:ABC transporter permease subunit n=1 Tax=Heyndrickxia acidiproducens TaxID=1121084 RepID=UPI00036DEF85|nr:ABC transporter permease subunit [Heyndrickxia acidiproducens]
MRKKLQNLGMKLISWVIPILIVILWGILSQAGIIPTKILPSPVAVVQAGIHLTETGELAQNISISLFRALLGFFIGGAIGFVLGILNGMFRLSDLLVDTSVQMLRNIPHLAMIPLVILWFGIDETSKIFLVALGVLFPVYINTYHGIKSVDKSLIEMGKAYGLSGWTLFFQVIFLGALSSILAGIRYALGVMWTTLIVAETIASNSGIGYMSMNAREFMQMDIIVLSIIIYAILGKISDLIAKFFENRWLHWNRQLQ